MTDEKKYWVHPWEADAPERIWVWGWRADSVWQEQTWQHEDEPMSTMEYVRADLFAALTEQLAAARRDAEEAEAYAAELEAKLAKAVEALERVMVGGNHLATILPDIVPSAETEPLIALEEMGYGYRYEAWCCWRSIMLARTTLAELTGEPDDR